MGSFSHLIIADYPLFEVKYSFVAELIALLFLPEDYIFEERSYSTKNKLIWGDSYEDEKGVFTFRGFRQTVKNCRERFEIYGVNSIKAKKNFKKARKIAKDDCFDVTYGFPINKVSYENYLIEISDIIKTQDINFEQSYHDFRSSLIAGQLGIYGQELKYWLYSILSVVSDDSIIEYDLSDVINNGWIEEASVKNINIEKIIVLAEGKTDVEFISTSLMRLYPHLFYYYHFIEFAEYNVESSASALVKLIRSFAASNVKHPIIALFDNDTAGIKEMKTLNSIRLPENIKVLKLPDIELAKKYPTIGPTGIKKMNVNGLACGIEMYLGVDILTKNNELIPIQWKGYDEKEKKYQGVISDKIYVQKKFTEAIRTDKALKLDEMKKLLINIFDAFK